MITSVNGQAVRSHGDLARALEGLPKGDEATLALVCDRKPMMRKVPLDNQQPGQGAVEL